MTLFLAWAALLAAGGALFLGLPLLRRGTGGARPWATGIASLVLLLGGGATLYPLLSNYSWKDAEAREHVEREAGIPALLAATEASPASVEAWVKLGDGYSRIKEWGPALRAFGRANALGQGRDATALVGYGQAILQTGDERRTEEAIGLFEQALAIAPHSEVALFYTAIYYMQSGELPKARERFTTMLSLDPPGNVRGLLEKQVAQIDEQIAEARTAAAASVHLEVSLAPKLAGQVPAGSSLFVFVPAPAGGPPLAVKRLGGTLPQQLTLSGTDAMIAGHGIKAGDTVKVVARLSKGGSPTASPGDPYGEAQARVGAPGTVAIVIDRVTPAK